MPKVFISLGSNLGNREQYLKDAKACITHDVGEIIAESSIAKTAAEGFKGAPFLNQVIKVETTLSPECLLIKTQAIEKTLGRTQKTVIKNGNPIYSNRVIDIDILLYDDLQINTEILTIPHPRMFEREFLVRLMLQVGKP